MNVREIAAYLKIKGDIDEKTVSLINEIYPEAERAPLRKSIARVDIVKTNMGIQLKNTDIYLTGRLAERHFANCGALYVILASLGQESERKMKETFALSPTKGLILDACYSELLERRLDKIEEELEKNGEKLTSRISCGYGDLPLKTQRPLLETLGAERYGVFLNESCMLVPNKSVIALVGVKNEA